jgi:hypothetical protein
MMGIVHGALQRDLVRAREVLSARPFPAGRQRSALGQHVGWLMDFLHAHHTSEDEGLWPAVRARNPRAGALLDSLEEDHRRIEPAAVAVRAAAEEYACSEGDARRVALVEALDELATVLFGHLEREVAEAMPIVATTLTQDEWHAIDQKHNIKSKSLGQLGFEGHWLLDGLDREGYAVVTQVVPPLPRFILLHGFARSYRRRMAAVWLPDRTNADASRR